MPIALFGPSSQDEVFDLMSRASSYRKNKVLRRLRDMDVSVQGRVRPFLLGGESHRSVSLEFSHSGSGGSMSVTTSSAYPRTGWSAVQKPNMTHGFNFSVSNRDRALHSYVDSVVGDMAVYTQEMVVYTEMLSAFKYALEHCEELEGIVRELCSSDD